MAKFAARGRGVGPTQGQSLPAVQHLMLGLRASAILHFGTPAQYEALVAECALESAARNGTLDCYLANENARIALRAERELAARNPCTGEDEIEMSPEPGTAVAHDAKRAKVPVTE